MTDPRRCWNLHGRALGVEAVIVLLMIVFIVSRGKLGLGQGEGDLRPLFIGALVVAASVWGAGSTAGVTLLARRLAPGVAVFLAHALTPVAGLMVLAPLVLLVL